MGDAAERLLSRYNALEVDFWELKQSLYAKDQTICRQKDMIDVLKQQADILMGIVRACKSRNAVVEQESREKDEQIARLQAELDSLRSNKDS